MPIIVQAVRYSDEKKKKRRIKKNKKEKGPIRDMRDISQSGKRYSNDIPTHDTLRLPKNTSGYRYTRKRISGIPGKWVCM